jgi:hypothetical protein
LFLGFPIARGWRQTLNIPLGVGSFPRKVFDETGAFTVGEPSRFLVSSPLIQHFAEITYARRDLQTALEMVRICAEELELEDDSPIEQSLWISSIIMYCKPFKRSNARKHFDAKGFIEGALDADGLNRHEYLLNLRDKMLAHDDSLGESKLLTLFLLRQAPKHVHEVGIGGGMKRVVSMGTDIARDLTPHFECVSNLLADYEAQERDRTVQQLIQHGFNDVTLLGHYKDEELDVSQQGVLARYGKRLQGSE